MSPTDTETSPKADDSLLEEKEKNGKSKLPQNHSPLQDKPLVELTRLQFVFVFIALALSILLAALDQTIVSTAIPQIVTEFKAANLISWVGTGYLLTATSFSPIYGKFADVFGRKLTLIFAITVFEIGSLICGLAPSMEALIAGRVIQGIGGGGIFSLVLIVISDIVTFQDRGKYQGIIGAVFGLASVIGPLAGGGFTDSSLTWRWCFYINLPVGGFTLLVIIFLLHFPKREDKSFWQKVIGIDYVGLMFILAAVVSLLLPLQFGGTVWPWDAWYTIFCFALCVVLVGILVFIELKVAKDPIIPGNVFMNLTVYMTLFIAFMVGASFLSVTYYIPTYFQVIIDDNATVSGLKTIPLIVGLITCSIISGIIISRTGRMTIFFYFGGVVTIVAISLFTLLDVDTEYWKIALIQFVFGIGIGGMLQTRILALQAAVDSPRIAVATSLSNFMQTLGASVGIAIFGVVFTNKVYDELITKIPPQFAKDKDAVHALANQPNAIREILKEIPGGEFILPDYLKAYVVGMRYAFYAAIPFACCILIAALFVKQYALPAMKKADVENGSTEEAPTEVELAEEVEIASVEEPANTPSGSVSEGTKNSN